MHRQPYNDIYIGGLVRQVIYAKGLYTCLKLQCADALGNTLYLFAFAFGELTERVNATVFVGDVIYIHGGFRKLYVPVSRRGTKAKSDGKGLLNICIAIDKYAVVKAKGVTAVDLNISDVFTHFDSVAGVSRTK